MKAKELIDWLQRADPDFWVITHSGESLFDLMCESAIDAVGLERADGKTCAVLRIGSRLRTAVRTRIFGGDA